MTMNTVAVVVESTREVLFVGRGSTPTVAARQCEHFVENAGRRIVADCPRGTAIYVR